MPIRTIDASGSKMREHSFGGDVGVGVARAILLLGVHTGLCLRGDPLKGGESAPWKECNEERLPVCIAAKDLLLPTVVVAMMSQTDDQPLLNNPLHHES
jgi:hypothetical protein